MTYLGPVATLEYIHIKIFAQMSIFEDRRRNVSASQ